MVTKIIKITFVIFIVQVQSGEKLLLYGYIQMFQLIIIFKSEVILSANVKNCF